MGNGVARSKGVSRASATKGDRAQGKDINNSHQMQKKGGEGGTRKHTELL